MIRGVVLAAFIVSVWSAVPPANALEKDTVHYEQTIKRCATLLGAPGKIADGVGLTRPTPEWLELRLGAPERGGSIWYLGVPHVSTPQPELFSYLDRSLRASNSAAAYVEVNDTSFVRELPPEASEVVARRGEPSYLGYIARRDGVPVLPLEPRPAELYSVVSSGFSADQIAMARVLREVQILRDRRRLFGDELESAARQSLERERKLATEAGKSVSFSNILEFTLAVNSTWPGLDWRQVPAEWSNPLLSPEKTGGKFVNRLFREEKRARDEHAFRLLSKELLTGRRVFVVAGRNHLETQAPALRCIATAQL